MNTKMTIEIISLLQQNLEGIDQTTPLLNLQEREIVLLCHLKTNPTEYEVGYKMCIRPQSVENYKKRIADKLGLKGRRAVVNFVLKNYKLFEELSQYFIKPAQRTEQGTGNSSRKKTVKLRGLSPHDLRG
jgi:DNA-binding CsgD family transcriptional regulator